MPPSAATRKTAPKMVARERVFVLRWKICDMVLLENWVEARRILLHSCTDARYREKILRSSFSRLFMRLAIINTSSGFCRAWERKNLKNFLKRYATQSLPAPADTFLRLVTQAFAAKSGIFDAAVGHVIDAE